MADFENGDRVVFVRDVGDIEAGMEATYIWPTTEHGYHHKVAFKTCVARVHEGDIAHAYTTNVQVIPRQVVVTRR